MIANEKSTKRNWIDPDDAPELTKEMAARAQIAPAGKAIRPAAGTLTKRGRPPVGGEPKQQVTLRLPRDVTGHFKSGGPGWQTRIGEVLTRHATLQKRKRALPE